MSFIFAQRLDDLVFFISDSFSKNDLTQEKIDWFMDPLGKVVNIRGEWIIAYAGNGEIARHGFTHIVNNSKTDPVEFLMSCHKQHVASIDKYVEFAVCRVSDLNLIFIKNGEQISPSASYLGSKTAMEIFQSRKQQNVEGIGTSISFIKLLDNVAEQSSAIYRQSLSAFQQTLLGSDDSFGGFAVPFIVSNSDSSYGSWLCRNVR